MLAGGLRGKSAAILALSVGVLGVVTAPNALADNKRLNDGVVANVYTVQHQAGCTNNVTISPQLQLAAQWHANDVLNNRALDADIGSDGSTVQDRANAAGFKGAVAETVAINRHWRSTASRSSTSGTTARTTWRSCRTAPTRKWACGR
jgi:uncharacterized protein YkwD